MLFIVLSALKQSSSSVGKERLTIPKRKKEEVGASVKRGRESGSLKAIGERTGHHAYHKTLEGKSRQCLALFISSLCEK